MQYFSYSRVYKSLRIKTHFRIKKKYIGYWRLDQKKRYLLQIRIRTTGVKVILSASLVSKESPLKIKPNFSL